MRYATVIIYPDQETFHPIAHKLDREPALQRKAVHSVKLMHDGTIVMLGEVEGNLDRYREIMRESDEVLTYAVSGDETGYTYSQVESSEQTRELLRRRDEGDFVIEMPIEYTDDGGQKVTIIGEEESLLELSDLFDVEGADLELVSTGPYSPDAEGVFAGLTARQREVLETALDRGYYEHPRQATLEDIAGELGVDHGTVGKHIRAIESKVFEKYVP